MQLDWMGVRPLRNSPLVVALWISVFAAILVWIDFKTPGWDVAVYQNAIHSLQSGHDPYMDATRIQKLVYSQGPIPSNIDPPFTYNYPPITLPILGLLGRLPVHLAGFIYWSMYAVAILIQISVGLLLTNGREKRIFHYLAPVAIFFPGLLADGTVLSGNVAHILYAAVLLATVIGWRRNVWRSFYIATLVVSCVKLPFLSLVVIPVLSSTKQWWPAGLTALGGFSLFILQPLLYPSLFRHYLESVDLLFSLSHDFGCSPAGIFSQWLVAHDLPYSAGGLVFYLAYALPLAGFLFYLSRRYLAGSFPLMQWAPVLLVGVVLLNPRLIEYDVAPITLPLTLIVWRVTTHCIKAKQVAIVLVFLFAVANAFAVTSWSLRKIIDCPLLVIIFLAGSWHLLHSGRRIVGSATEIELEHFPVVYSD
jgi:hypothetical protein